MKMVNTVAGLIMNDKGEILCAQRSASKYEYISYKWEFPGGKVEEGENDFQTLSRELQEELDIKVDIQEKLCQVEHDYPDFHLSMPVYKCKLLSNSLKLLVHTDLKWLQPNQMLSLNWADADVETAKLAYDTLGKK